jgi:hypothetical protein
MHSFRQLALRIVHVIGKAIVVRAVAVGPVSREREAELRAFLADDPSMWGYGQRNSR